MTESELKEAGAEFIVLLKAFDDTFSQTIYSRSSYKFSEIVWGARFVPMIEYTPKGTVLDLAMINEYEKAELPVLETEEKGETIQL